MMPGSSLSTGCSSLQAFRLLIQTPKFLPWWTIPTQPNLCGFSSRAQSYYICATNSTRMGSSSPRNILPVQSVKTGWCGRWAAHHLLVEALDISTTMLRWSTSLSAKSLMTILERNPRNPSLFLQSSARCVFMIHHFFGIVIDEHVRFTER